MIIAALGVATAVLTLATAAVGVFAANKSSQAAEQQVVASSVASSASSAQTQNSAELLSASSQVESLSSALLQAQADNSSLSSQLKAAGSGATPTSPPADTASVRREGDINITSQGTEIDLDSSPSDPQWAAVGFAQPDLMTYDGFLSIDKIAMPFKQVEPTYAQCRDTVGYNTTQIEYNSVSAGDYYCLKTSEGRLAVMQFIDKPSDKVNLHATVYDKA